jgi:hypothetical protein
MMIIHYRLLQKAARLVTIFMASEFEILRDILSQVDFSAIKAFARKDKRTLSYLTALTYDQEREISWRAIEALGLAAAQIAENEPEYVRIHLRRLVWLLNDESGGIGWRAPEAIGEIICHRPNLFSNFIPLLVNLIDMEPEDAIRFRAGWLWAIARLAEVDLESARHVQPWINGCLDDPDPQVRGMAVLCLAALSQSIPPEKLRDLQVDQGQVELYVSPNIVTLTIAEWVKSLIDKPDLEWGSDDG